MINRIHLLSALFFVFGGSAYAKKKPNVIVVLADDIGIGDISYYRKMHSGKIVLETPNIDKLASAGMVFTNAHSPAALCAPSRYGIITGNNCYRSPQPWGVWGSYEKSPILDNDITLGRLMKNAGYNTSFFGKWHLGGDFYTKDTPGKIYRGSRNVIETNLDISKLIDGPKQKGFDYSFTYPAGIQDVPYSVYENENWFPLEKNSEIGLILQKDMSKIDVKLDKMEGLGDLAWDPHKSGPLLVNKAIDYINKNAESKKPFFMYYCSQAVHLPHTPPNELNGIKIAGTTPSKHMDMIKELDVQIGMMVDELKRLRIYENTVFIFTSDNGGLHSEKQTMNSGHQPNDIYRGSKNTEYEGGHRVPFIAVWPTKIKPNQIFSKPIVSLNILATLAAITNQIIPENQALDSYNLLPVLLNKKNAAANPFLMLQSGTGKQLILIENEWKLIIQVDVNDKTDKIRYPVALFNIHENPSEIEEKNLIQKPEYKSKVESMFKKYNETRENKTRTGS